MVTVAELHALKEGLQSLDSAISALQQGVERAEAASAATPAPKANGSASPPPASDVAQSQTATAPPPEPAAPPTFDELAARIRAHDEEAGQLRSMLRERFAVLQPPAADAGAAGAPLPEGGSPGVAEVEADKEAGPRTFRLTDPQMSGDDIKAFQAVLNLRFARWGIGLHIREDGDYGAATRLAARRVARGLGLASDDYALGITPAVRMLIRTPSRRTPEPYARAALARACEPRVEERAAQALPRNQAQRRERRARRPHGARACQPRHG